MSTTKKLLIVLIALIAIKHTKDYVPPQARHTIGNGVTIAVMFVTNTTANLISKWI
jgi:hypothetical protein